jgi:acyl dehydratase
MKFFEDIAVGERHQIGSHTFTAADIKRFATAFDPQAFHTDESRAEQSHFGRLCASGWHTTAIWMKLNVREQQRIARDLEAAGIPVARIGPSPGFDELKWLKPVYADDTVSFETEVVGKKASRSRPEWGLVSLKNTGLNQHGEPVITFIGHVFVERRDKATPDGS